VSEFPTLSIEIIFAIQTSCQVGASTITIMTMILPGWFNLFLVAGTKKAGGKINTNHRATFMEYEKMCF
jgi:hypothetical protein